MNNLTNKVICYIKMVIVPIDQSGYEIVYNIKVQ